MSHERCSECRCQQPEAVPRRGFLGAALGALAAGAALCLAPARALAARKVAIRLSKAPALQKVGGSMIVKIFGRSILLIRDSADSVRALTAICSHKRTSLAYDAAKKRVVCANHGSWFTLEGKVRKGPATKDLHPVYWCKLDKAKRRILLKI